MPKLEAFAAVASMDRFKVRAILSRPTFFLASPLSLWISVAVHSRRTEVLLFLATIAPIVGNELLACSLHFATYAMS
jgi:hypothetical protein